MDLFFSQLSEYCAEHSTSPSEVLYELERETHLKTLAPQMLSGPLQGRFLSFLSKVLRPRRILEIGTFTGYAAICLSEGLSEGGLIHTVEVNRELEYIIRKYLEKAGCLDKVQLHMGDAKEIIPQLDEVFDLAFVDAGKKDNEYFYNLALEKTRKGGVILIDNVLWSGKIVRGETDRDTRTIDQFNKMIQADDRVDNLILPLRDGMTMVMKK